MAYYVRLDPESDEETEVEVDYNPIRDGAPGGGGWVMEDLAIRRADGEDITATMFLAQIESVEQQLEDERVENDRRDH